MAQWPPYAPPTIYDQTQVQPSPQYGAYGPPPAGAPGFPGQAPSAGYASAGWLGPPPAGAGGPPQQHPPVNRDQHAWGAPAPPAAAPAYHQPHAPPPAYAPAPGGGPARRKKALLIGCCYPGTSAALSGCINDVQCIEYCLKGRFGFPAEGIVVLRDDTQHPDFAPTRHNIMRAMQWLMSDQRPGDSLFFHFSGHGSQKRDYSGDESDGMDETILPTDYKRAGQIADDELNAALVRPLQPGVVLHAVIDACHSGTAFDLAYQTRVDTSGRFYWKGKRGYQKGTSGGTVFQLGACKDSQTAADTNRMSGGAYTGAATYAFIDAIKRYGTNQTYAVVLGHMQETLRRHGGGGMPGGGGSMGGLLASFLLGPSTMGGQTPVMCCDKPVDLTVTPLGI